MFVAAVFAGVERCRALLQVLAEANVAVRIHDTWAMHHSLTTNLLWLQQAATNASLQVYPYWSCTIRTEVQQTQ